MRISRPTQGPWRYVGVSVADIGVATAAVVCGLTFDMRGGRQQAKLDVGRPLDGRVRALCVQGHELLACNAVRRYAANDDMRTRCSEAPHLPHSGPTD